MSTGRRRIVAGTIVSTIVVVLVATLVFDGPSTPPFDEAKSLAGDADRFNTGLEAGETLAHVGELLNRALDDCRAAGQPDVRCRAIGSASGYVQVSAVAVLRCTAPGRFEARTRVAAYLADIEALDDAATSAPPPPPLIEC